MLNIMDISLLTSQVLFLLTLFFSISDITAQSNFSCSVDSPSSCETYVAYFAQPPNYLSLGNVSDLFEASSSSIAKASNLVSGVNETKLFPGQLLLVPVTCGCTAKRYFANITYQIKKDDSYYLVSVNSFGNLSNWNDVQGLNPTLNPNLLQIGVEVIFPLFCKCPSETHLKNGISYIITYVWQPTDDVLQVSAKFNASLENIASENGYRNFSTAVSLPVMIPVSQLPALSQIYPTEQSREGSHSKRPWIIILIVSLGGAMLIFLLTALLVHSHRSRQRKKEMKRVGSSLETSVLIKMKEQSRCENFEPKITQGKLLPGVSGYLSKPIMYETKAIIEATANFDEHCRIGGSVYRATINGQVLAVKKTKEDVTEELKILQKVNHANLVRLMGISSDTDGNRFLVYEYAENGSLDKWLHSKSSSSSAILTWSQRLIIALDVANGLQYMHEHTQPTIVHRDIRATNILLNSGFKAMIAKLSLARSATNSAMPKVDVFGFGVVLLELLSGKRAMETKENGEVALLWKDIRWILEVEDNRAERLRSWIDPNLESFYPIDGAISLATLARACTLDKSMERPSMGEIVFNLSVLTQSSSETSERSWTSGAEGDEVIHIISPVTAR
ncbi:serine/threonine receptor-like kinase NFP [Juglans microcarpa x Juglans regia]|uniref:serine/threonine receptor-like kinase NFP n=1 Tax=Juglans microcarpa x Juglans regia TaxID=2249226 RepID=UPI001B7E7EC1|nr:serine/threonine receptor-like kinase NFP [Juglans microcarpa x Juglans regia]